MRAEREERERAERELREREGREEQRRRPRALGKMFQWQVGGEKERGAPALKGLMMP